MANKKYKIPAYDWGGIISSATSGGGGIGLISGVANLMLGSFGKDKEGEEEFKAYRNSAKAANMNFYGDASAKNTMGLTTSYAYGGVAMPNAELEGGEVFKTPNGVVDQVQGPSHADGGVPMQLPENTMIFSDRLKPKGSKKTYAEIAAPIEKAIKKYSIPGEDAPEKAAKVLMMQRKQQELDALFLDQEQSKNAKMKTNTYAYGGLTPNIPELLVKRSSPYSDMIIAEQNYINQLPDTLGQVQVPATVDPLMIKRFKEAGMSDSEAFNKEKILTTKQQYFPKYPYGGVTGYPDYTGPILQNISANNPNLNVPPYRKPFAPQIDNETVLPNQLSYMPKGMQTGDTSTFGWKDMHNQLSNRMTTTQTPVDPLSVKSSSLVNEPPATIQHRATPYTEEYGYQQDNQKDQKTKFDVGNLLSKAAEVAPMIYNLTQKPPDSIDPSAYMNTSFKSPDRMDNSQQIREAERSFAAMINDQSLSPAQRMMAAQQLQGVKGQIIQNTDNQYLQSIQDAESFNAGIRQQNIQTAMQIQDMNDANVGAYANMKAQAAGDISSAAQKWRLEDNMRKKNDLMSNALKSAFPNYTFQDDGTITYKNGQPITAEDMAEIQQMIYGANMLNNMQHQGNTNPYYVGFQNSYQTQMNPIYSSRVQKTK